MTTYRDSGVDQDAADALVPKYAEHAARTRRGTDGGLGGFAGSFPLIEVLARYERPVLTVSTDTTGTKIDLLRKAGRHRTAGWDCVAMNVDDVVCTGAEPLFFVDCIAIEHLDPVEATEIVGGVADACVEAGCELVGGETAQLPGLLTAGAYEVMGTCVGIVEYDRAWGPHLVKPGDALVGLAASGLHSNGYSLVRKLLEESGEEPTEELLVPTTIYARKLLAMAGGVEVHAVAHVTGGGLAGNVSRILPEGNGAAVDTTSWPRPGVYDWLSSHVDEDEIRATFNLGVGMVLATPDGPAAVAALADLEIQAWVVGEVDAAPGVRLL